MILRLTSVWLSVTAASAASIVCHVLASEVGAFHRSSHLADLPLISRAFFPDALLIYLFPLPLAAWAVIQSAKTRNNADLSLLIVTVTLGVSIVFVAVYVLAIMLPFIPGSPRVLMGH